MKTERMNADGHHQEAIAKLKKLAGNDADKKAAVATFEATLKTLITTRRTAVDMAVKNFQDGVVALKTERGTAMSSWSSSNEEALENAMESVRTACANGGESKEAALAFKKAMTASREEFKGAKSEFDFQTRLKALQQVRKDAIAKAVADFKTGFDAAKTILKTAMGESVSE
jgi:hypothetical protein